jgi:hypothetical protein
MQETPDQEWRRLTEHYAGMWDEELLDLAADYKDLTEMAQQTLRDEMKKRGLGEPTAPRARTSAPAAGATAERVVRGVGRSRTGPQIPLMRGNTSDASRITPDLAMMTLRFSGRSSTI